MCACTVSTSPCIVKDSGPRQARYLVRTPWCFFHCCQCPVCCGISCSTTENNRSSEIRTGISTMDGGETGCADTRPNRSRDRKSADEVKELTGRLAYRVPVTCSPLIECYVISGDRGPHSVADRIIGAGGSGWLLSWTVVTGFETGTVKKSVSCLVSLTHFYANPTRKNT